MDYIDLRGGAVGNGGNGTDSLYTSGCCDMATSSLLCLSQSMR